MFVTVFLVPRGLQIPSKIVLLGVFRRYLLRRSLDQGVGKPGPKTFKINFNQASKSKLPVEENFYFFGRFF